MRIVFIKPNMGRMEHTPYVDEARMEPLQLGVLAGMTPQDVSVSLIEDRCEDIPYDSPVDLVAITVEIFTAKRAYEISAEYRRHGVPVILGGFHPTLLPEEAGLHADSIVIGDAETAWPDIIEDAKNGNLKPVSLTSEAPLGTNPLGDPYQSLSETVAKRPESFFDLGNITINNVYHFKQSVEDHLLKISTSLEVEV